MPFENFYKEKDKSAERWQNRVGFAMLAVIGFCYFALNSLPSLQVAVPLNPEAMPPPPESELAKLEADRVERVRRVEALCESLPKPEKFEFVEKSPAVYSNSAMIVTYFYRSDRKFKEIRPFFVVFLSANGFAPFPNSETVFTRENHSIRIGNNPLSGGANYEIVCVER